MKIQDLIVRRPFTVFIILALIELLLPSFLIPFWIIRVQKIKNEVKFVSQDFDQVTLSGVDNAARMLVPVNSSATSIARVLSSSLDQADLSFSNIQTKVAPTLFQALSTIPHLSQISYVGLDGLFFSFYYKDNQQLFALYSNSSFRRNANTTSSKYSWYTQPANGDKGTLYGEAASIPPSVDLVNASWFQRALNSTNGVASLGNSWGDDHYLLFLNTAYMNGRGAISLGYRVKSLIDIFLTLNLNGGSMFLATKDGNVLMEGIPNTRMVLSGNSVSFQLLNQTDDNVIAQVGSVTCQPNNGELRASIFKFWERKYTVYCSPIEIVGVQSVYALALPYNGLESQFHWNIKLAFWLLIVMVVLVVISIFIFVVLTIRVAGREMCLQAELIKQKEETQREERKSKNKSLAFATANHDIRASLAGITGLIEMSHNKVNPESELSVHLRQMETCTRDLLGILNSVLDMSKIEAGMMQLKEEQFELGQLLEEVVDMFYTVAIKKGVDVVLDLDDESFRKFSHVEGDRGKLKQILSNLLSNAVKFTSEGYVSVRVWAKKPSLEKSILASARTKSVRYLSCLLFKNHKGFNDLESTREVDQVDPNYVEFAFEVNDTGKGVPKEKQKSIFENYVQVKESNPEQEGTGLGLGIVKSLVHLMGGDIQILDKETGERGTCFRFTARFIVCETVRQSTGNTREEDIRSNCGGNGYVSSDSYQNSGPSTLFHSPKRQFSHVVLFMASEERRKVSQKLIESRGVKVTVVKHWEQLSTSLKKIKHKRNMSWFSLSSRLDVTPSRNSSTRSKETPLSALDGTDQVSVSNSSDQKGMPDFVLIVIDANAGPFRELSRAVAEFRREFVGTYSKVVWLDKPGARSLHYQGLDENKLPSSDVIMTKPFHGSHITDIIGFLPEFQNHQARKDEACQSGARIVTPARSKFGYSRTEQNLPPTKPGEIELKEEDGEPSNKIKPLLGKRTLVAEDDRIQLVVTKAVLQRLGALVESCKNGEEAVELVSKGLRDQKKHGVSHINPYDYIFMDCQMPEMDGAEATLHIREEEARYGVRSPIVGLTAHTDGEALDRMYRAGIDFHLNKPLKAQALQEALSAGS